MLPNESTVTTFGDVQIVDVQVAVSGSNENVWRPIIRSYGAHRLWAAKRQLDGGKRPPLVHHVGNRSEIAGRLDESLEIALYHVRQIFFLWLTGGKRGVVVNI